MHNKAAATCLIWGLRSGNCVFIHWQRFEWNAVSYDNNEKTVRLNWRASCQSVFRLFMMQREEMSLNWRLQRVMLPHTQSIYVPLLIFTVKQEKPNAAHNGRYLRQVSSLWLHVCEVWIFNRSVPSRSRVQRGSKRVGDSSKDSSRGLLVDPSLCKWACQTMPRAAANPPRPGSECKTGARRLIISVHTSQRDRVNV